jgi:cytochrome bd-type quinol oxidase subunit 1
MAMTAASPNLRTLRFVLGVKIVGTILLFCAPMLMLDQDGLKDFYGLRPEPRLAAWMIGVAYAALIVGYAAGWVEAERGRYPGWVVAMGIVSNGGGAVAAIVAVAIGDIRLDALRPCGFAAIGFAALIAISLVICHIGQRRQRQP